MKHKRTSQLLQDSSLTQFRGGSVHWTSS